MRRHPVSVHFQHYYFPSAIPSTFQQRWSDSFRIPAECFPSPSLSRNPAHPLNISPYLLALYHSGREKIVVSFACTRSHVQASLSRRFLSRVFFHFFIFVPLLSFCKKARTLKSRQSSAQPPKIACTYFSKQFRDIKNELASVKWNRNQWSSFLFHFNCRSIIFLRCSIILIRHYIRSAWNYKKPYRLEAFSDNFI